MITTKILDSHDLIEDACALLYEEYISVSLWKFSNNNPSELMIINKNNRKLLVDRIDHHAIWFGAFDRNKLVGCIRLFKATNSVPFEIEMYPTANDIVEKYVKNIKHNVYEGSRACVSTEYKGEGILYKLYLAMLEYVEKNAASVFGSASSGYIKSVLRRIEWPCKIENAFKFEESDSSPVNFYLATYQNGQVAQIIKNIKLIDKRTNRKNLSILDALGMVAPIFPAPMYWHDLNGVVLGINIQCLNAMNKSIEEVLGKTPYEFYSKKIADYIWEHSEQVMKSGEILSQEEYTYNDLGEYVSTYLAVKAPLYDTNSNIIGVVATSIDITAQKDAEKLKVENANYQVEKNNIKKFTSFIDNVLNVIQTYKINTVNETLGFNHTTTPQMHKIKLTKREEQILYFLAMGKSPKEISRILGKFENKIISDATIASMINKQLYTKFDVANYGQLIDKATNLKLIPFIPESLVNFFNT